MPKFVSIKKNVDKTLKKLEGYIRAHQGSKLPEEVFYRLMKTLAKQFKSKETTLAESCSNIKEEPFTPELLENTVWRLCANADKLQQNSPVLFYSKFQYTALEEIQFESFKLDKDNKYETVIRVLTGHYAPGTIVFSFTKRTVDRILYHCGYNGRKYIAGRIEDCFPGLFSLAQLSSYAEYPKIFRQIVDDEDIVAFNRKNIIGLRAQKLACPHGYHNQCRQCPLSKEECLASYKEKKND